MAQMNNLTDDNVYDLQRVFNTKIKPENPEATLRIYEQKDKNSSSEIQQLRDEIAELKSMIKHIFDGHVLVKGKWVAVNQLDL